MATRRRDITSFVGKLLEQDDLDALREGLRVLATQAVMEMMDTRPERGREMGRSGQDLMRDQFDARR